MLQAGALTKLPVPEGRRALRVVANLQLNRLVASSPGCPVWHAVWFVG